MGARTRQRDWEGDQAKKSREFQEQMAKDAFEREKDLLRATGQEAQRQYTQAMQDFDTATTGTPAAVSRLQSLIREQALPEQQRAMQLGRIARQQQGVRGIDAAVLEQRQANTLNRQLAQQAENVALQQQLKDREARQRLAAQRVANLQGRTLGGAV